MTAVYYYDYFSCFFLFLLIIIILGYLLREGGKGLLFEGRLVFGRGWDGSLGFY